LERKERERKEADEKQREYEEKIARKIKKTEKKHQEA